jgi:hypothetical protein
MNAMLTEESLILLATLVASGMLVLGVLELLWPTTPRRPVEDEDEEELLAPMGPGFALFGSRGFERSASDTIRARLGAPPLWEREVPIRVVKDQDVELTHPERDEPMTTFIDDDVTESGAEVELSEPPRAWDATALLLPTAGPLEAEATPSAALTMEPESAVADEPGDMGPSSDEPAEPATAIATAPPAPQGEGHHTGAERGRTVLPIETCIAMYNEHRYAEVVSLGSAALEVHARMAAVSNRPDEASAMHDLVGLARQELGDREGARGAFGAAIAGATSASRPTYIRHLLNLVRGVVDGVNVKDDAGVRVGELRACLTALGNALDVAPGNESLIAAHEATRDAIVRICEAVLPFAVDEDADPDARALLLDVAGDDRLAGAWRDRLRERLGDGASADAPSVRGWSAAGVSAGASGADVGQLTLFAVRAVQEGREDDALHALERAERLASSMRGEEADERREELERRLWWGYIRLGLRRLEAGAFETALEPFFRALRLGRGDDDRLGETRGALLRALDGIAATTLPALEALRETDAAAAERETAGLARTLQAWTTHGLTEEDLGEVHDGITRLGQTLV